MFAVAVGNVVGGILGITTIHARAWRGKAGRARVRRGEIRASRGEDGRPRSCHNIVVKGHTFAPPISGLAVPTGIAPDRRSESRTGRHQCPQAAYSEGVRAWGNAQEERAGQAALGASTSVVSDFETWRWSRPGAGQLESP